MFINKFIIIPKAFYYPRMTKNLSQTNKYAIIEFV